MSAVHIGIDVGGTFTKAVAMVHGELLGQATVLTTHRAPEGVAAGVLQALDRLLRGSRLHPAAVALVAHSTTQATNALLEGDVSPVGIVAMGPAGERARILRRAVPEGLEPVPGKRLVTVVRVLETDRGLSPEAVQTVLDELAGCGCRAIVASELFGVEDPRHERAVAEAARRRGLLATTGSELTGVYGFEVRTATAAVNASILPRMLETAAVVERSIEGRIAAPLLILKGDGGVATMETFRTQPLLTLFSGPAAGLSGALKVRPILHGLFLEVGGTSTNIGLVREGHVALRYVRIGDFATCVRAADVRVVGVAGGSLVRLRGRRIAALGPRSAHIAGLPYAAFTPPEEIVDPELVVLAPLPGDPADYAAVRTRAGKTVALTPTCAANALGLVPESDYARGSAQAARLAFAPLARHLGCSVDAAARALLEQAARQIEAPVRELLRDHRIGLPETALLVGGGGAAAVGPAVAGRLGLPMERVPHAEVISSIGAASAMIRVEREEALPRPSPDALAALREQVQAAALAMGAAPEALTVRTEFVPERSAMRAVATGSLAFSPNGGRVLTGEEQRALAARAVGAPDEAVCCRLRTPVYAVFEAPARRRPLLGVAPWRLLHRVQTAGRPAAPGAGGAAAPDRRRWARRRAATAVAVVDLRGAVPLVLERGEAIVGPPQVVTACAAQRLRERRGRWGLAPEVRLVVGHRLVDLSSLTTPAQLLEALPRELAAASAGQEVAVLLAES